MRPSGSVFGPGTTPVVCRTSDKAGNAASAQFNVVVQDVSPPVLTVPPLVVAEALDVLGARVTYAVSATDAQGLEASTTVSIYPKTVDLSLVSDPLGLESMLAG